MCYFSYIICPRIEVLCHRYVGFDLTLELTTITAKIVNHSSLTRHFLLARFELYSREGIY